MTFEQAVQIGWMILGALTVLGVFYGIYALTDRFVKPLENTPKAREVDLNKKGKEADIVLRVFQGKLASIEKLPPASQADALKILRAEVMVKAPDWRVFGLGGSGENGFLQSGTRVIAESDELLTQLKETKAWAQLQPLLLQLAQKVTGKTDGTPITTSAPPVSKPIGTDIGKK